MQQQVTRSLPDLLLEVRRIAIEAGERIMEVFDADFDIETKADNSPVTTADLAANTLIVRELKKLKIQFPILSEESDHLSFKERSVRETYWLVDPLDGTKEFINRRNTFTVNIALIHKGKSVLGVVYAPAQELSYFACKGLGSFKQLGKSTKTDNVNAIIARDIPKNNAVFLGSLMHTGEAMQGFLDNYQSEHGNYKIQNMGSSLKMCMVAEGLADCYPRFWLTSEWDTAAAHCILDEAGGKIVKLDMSPLLYNTKDSLLNPFFFAIGNNTIDWKELVPD